jgi:hypothetical protein
MSTHPLCINNNNTYINSFNGTTDNQVCICPCLLNKIGMELYTCFQIVYRFIISKGQTVNIQYPPPKKKQKTDTDITSSLLHEVLRKTQHLLIV